MLFADRADAGRKLVRLVKNYQHQIDLVLAIPRGGVEVGAEIARALGKPLELITARKIGAPHNPEVAIGAIAPDGSSWFNPDLVHQLSLSQGDLAQLTAKAVREAEARKENYGRQVDMAAVKGKGVLVVDDGAATGATLLACIDALARAGANPIGAAVPVAAIQVVSIIEDKTDYFLALETPYDFMAVSQYYQNFAAVADNRIREILQRGP